MERADRGLAFMLQYENIAWYENGTVRILDRRVYPTKVEFVECKTVQEVAKAITDMVTQSAGPYTAAQMGMALAAYQARNQDENGWLDFMKKAAHTIAHARPTTVDRMTILVNKSLDAAIAAREKGENVPQALVDHAIRANNARYRKIGKMAEYLLDMLPQNAKVLTQCFGETIVGQTLRAARERGNELKIFCAETRPYFQGARLTASVAKDMGFDTTVITDNMPAFTIQKEKIDVFTSAADVICGDGHIVNKVGTFQIAIVANYLGIPYFATGAPDKGHSTIDTVQIEMRDPEFTLQAMGVRTAMAGVKGYYPAFDITPPRLVSGVVTDLGVFSPFNLAQYDKTNGEGEYG